jgi:multidrug efflux pump subunit AcrB
MKIGVWSSTQSQMEMTTLAKWTIRPRLMAIPGVANVAIWGQRDRQIQVLVDPDRLAMHNVTLDDVTRATRDATTPGAGGFIDTPNQRLSVTHISAVNAPKDLAVVPVAFRNNAPLRLGDVAEVTESFPPPIGDAIINDQPGLLLIVEWAEPRRPAEQSRGDRQNHRLDPGRYQSEDRAAGSCSATRGENETGSLGAIWLDAG